MTVTRPARLTGAALAAVLALVPFVWILGDLAALGSPEDLLRHWADTGLRAAPFRAATGPLDPLLCLAAALTALAALRSRHAAGALAATGAVTLAARLPGLWSHATGPLVTALLETALAAGLLAVALLGRRPRPGPHDPVPTRPRPRPAAAAGILLALAALALTVREVRHSSGPDPMRAVDRFTGGRSAAGTALAVPPGWLSAVLVLLLAAAACSALTAARHTRPLGLLAGGLLLGDGTAASARALFPYLRPDVQPAAAPALDGPALAAGLGTALAGAAVLVLLAGRGAPDPAPGPRPPEPAPPPPYPRPPGW
ncbi:hypothetical protein ACIQRS_02650 [Streptomyces termitum]|uniref:Uncharacterized protein n=1 Tax=Streptomyces termitum TaxID=67368 RepID=A0A918W703_9ACTN|nr:hypothetical protein [Streptomyces termitum]GHA72666.1 hypothetical protein GCM10010305_13700 [Streptomyces termitum]